MGMNTSPYERDLRGINLPCYFVLRERMWLTGYPELPTFYYIALFYAHAYC